ncbi:MAG: alpha/beta fold hydrolase [Deltaproteobacteria bacterium]|nr:alpha/beta fold hydrolase [Deltaproteobacteria bacterium]
MTTLFCILLILIKATVYIVALTVLLSFTMAWYERANSRPDLIERRFTTRGLCIAIWLLIQETACLLLTILLRPFGWLRPQLPDAGQDVRPPVILLHGLFQNRSCLFWMQYRLRSAGYKQIISINTPPWRDLETLTESLVKKVDELRIKMNVDKVILVGHSMGGMIARNYVQNRGGAAYVHGMVTLGSPHHGSKLAPFALSAMGKTLLPGSEFLRQFNSVTWPEETRAVSIYTRYDNIVMPAESGIMEGSQTVELNGMGHTSLLFHPRSLQAVIDALNNITA